MARDGWLASADVPAAVETDQLERLVRSTPAAWLLSSLGALICYMQFADGPAGHALTGWFVAFLAVGALRLASSLLRTPEGTPMSATWVLWWRASTVVHAGLWGVLPLVLREPGPAEAESVLHMTLAAVAMGGSVRLPGMPRLLKLHVVLLLAPLVLRDLVIGAHHWLLAFMVFLIGVYSLISGRNQTRALVEIHDQRQRNAELIEALRRENERSESARRAAEQAIAARARFFAAANHDLRQPLNAMGLLAQTLHTRPQQVDVQELSSHLVECVDGMTEVVDELLDISRLDAGSLALQRGAFALDELVRELARTYAPLAQSKQLPIHVDVPRLHVHCDRTLLARVISNLLSNAIRYTERGAVRVVARTLARADGDRVELAVEDTGIGIAEAELPRIFEEFYQVGNPARDRRLGLGLGLATVKRLSDLLDLQVTVQSHPGSGSRFSLLLPPCDGRDDGTASAPPSPAASDADPLAHRRVLVIEDDADSRHALLGLLRSWGCDARGVIDGPTALACVAEGFRPDALLVDLRLAGGASGVDAIEAVRAALSRPLPALIVTGDVGSERARAAQARGFTVLPKPVKAMPLRAFLGGAFADA